MPEYELRLRFTAANADQADRLAQAWAGTCAAEYGTRYAGLSPADDPYCDWCGTAIFPAINKPDRWRDRHGVLTCPANDEDGRHEPAGLTVPDDQAAQR